MASIWGKKLGLEWIMVWATVLMGIRVEVSRLWVVGVGVLADWQQWG